MDDALRINAKHLHEVEGLSIRQVAVKLGIGRKKAARLLSSCDVKKEVPVGIINPYERLIGEWYSEYPFLRAIIKTTVYTYSLIISVDSNFAMMR